MSEPNDPASPDLPRVEAVPLVHPASDPPLSHGRRPWISSPWPGWWGACLTTFGYWLMLLGAMIVIVLVAMLWLLVGGDGGQEVETVGGVKVPALLHLAITISVFMGYIAGFVYSIVALRLANGRGWSRLIGLRRLPLTCLLLAVLALPGFVLCSDLAFMGIDWLFRAIGNAVGVGEPRAMDTDLAGLFGAYHWSVIVLVIGVAPGVAEEFWCRGFLGRGLVGRYGVFVGVLMSSTLFGMLHLWPPAYVVVTALMGMALHFMYVMSRSLWVPIIIHALNNSLSGLQSLKVLNLDQLTKGMETEPVTFAVLAVGLLLFGGLALWSARGRLIDENGDPAQASDPGIMVPPAATGLRVVHAFPHMIPVTFTITFSMYILYLAFA